MKWTGAAVGMAIGIAASDLFHLHPITMFVCASVGYWLGYKFEADDEIPPDTELFCNLMLLYVSAAHANGAIHPKEKKRIQQLGLEISLELLPGRSDAVANECINNAFAVDPMPHWMCSETFCSFKPEYQTLVYLQSLSVLAADGDIDSSEEAWLSSLVANSQVDPGEWQMCTLLYRRDHSDMAGDLQSAAEVLEVEVDCTENELKKAWRKKASDYHPDRLMGLSEPVRKLAEEETRKVNHAYDTLSKRFKSHKNSGLVVLSDTGRFEDAETVKSGQVAVCHLCEQKNKVSKVASFSKARCGKCFAFLALERDIAEGLARRV